MIVLVIGSTIAFAFGLAFGPPATTHKARRIAANVAKLPDLLR